MNKGVLRLSSAFVGWFWSNVHTDFPKDESSDPIPDNRALKVF